MRSPHHFPLLEVGAYGLTEAAALVNVPVQTARNWFRSPKPGKEDKWLLRAGLPEIGGRKAINFLGLIELEVVARLRAVGLSLQRIRKVRSRLEERLGVEFPFCHRSILADRYAIFLETVAEEGSRLEDALTGQAAMPTVLLPYLKRIEYGAAGLASRWRIADGVVLDPLQCFGKPVVEELGVATRVLASTYFANNEDGELVADLFNVTPDAVAAAVRFEREYFSRAA